MAYSGKTSYLGLRNILPGDQNWYADALYNNQRIDALGKHIQVQSSPGAPSAFRVQVSSGALVDAIKILPKADGSLDIQIGRSGTGDRLIFAGSLTYSSMTLINTAGGSYNQFAMKVSADFQNLHDSKLSFDTQQNRETKVSFPTGFASAKPWMGSAAQLELELDGTTARQTFLSFTAKDNAGTIRTFVVPAYLV